MDDVTDMSVHRNELLVINSHGSYSENVFGSSPFKCCFIHISIISYRLMIALNTVSEFQLEGLLSARQNYQYTFSRIYIHRYGMHAG